MFDPHSCSLRTSAKDISPLDLYVRPKESVEQWQEGDMLYLYSQVQCQIEQQQAKKRKAV
jgi:hypothetical protein